MLNNYITDFLYSGLLGIIIYAVILGNIHMSKTLKMKSEREQNQQKKEKMLHISQGLDVLDKVGLNLVAHLDTFESAGNGMKKAKAESHVAETANKLGLNLNQNEISGVVEKAVRSLHDEVNNETKPVPNIYTPSKKIEHPEQKLVQNDNPDIKPDGQKEPNKP